VINEWYSGSISTIFPHRCYAQAIDRLPSDSLVLESAMRDLRAAEVAAEHGKRAPPEKPFPEDQVTPHPKSEPFRSLLPCVTTKPGQRCAWRRVT
jgi:hypothetical protein